MNHLQRLIAAATVGLALQSGAAIAQAPLTTAVPVPPVPAAIQVPAGNIAYLKGHAVGTQNYICQPSESGFAWKFLAPQATLFYTFQWGSTTVAQQITTHYLSPNPGEGGTARPTWQSSLDTSAIWARAVASSNDPAYVAAGAIPWLLLQIVGAQMGPTGGYLLTDTTYIHRLNTTGGIVPSTGCSQATNVGALAFVPYTADYYFYKSIAARM
jgi:hypothetical protein